MASTMVVLPWSTWATMATLRMSWRVAMMWRTPGVVRTAYAYVCVTRALPG
jgi:hypothetical protein